MAGEHHILAGKYWHTKLLNGGLFWIHLAVTILGLILGLFFSVTWVLVMILLHRLHLSVFNGCIISKLQHYTGGLPQKMSFIQFTIQRFFKLRLNLKQLNYLEYGFVLVAVGLALL